MIDPNSPLLTIPVLDTALKGATDPVVRVQILAAKVQVLQRDSASARSNATASSSATGDDNASAPSNAAQHDPTPLLAARLDLADGYLATNPTDHHSASAEASVVEVDCKRIQKRVDRLKSENAPLEPWMSQISALRKRAVTILADVDQGLGRNSRAERWRKIAQEL